MRDHRLADIVPRDTESGYRTLVEAIRANGQREPIVLLDGRILDGRHRWRACDELGLEPITREYGSRPGDGDDPLAFVLDVNANRRQMNTTQKAKMAANLVEEWGDLRGSSSKDEVPGIGRGAAQKAASLCGIGEATVSRALRLKRRAPDLFEMLDGDTLKLSHADAMMRAREKQGDAPIPGRKQRAPAVKASDRREQQRRALGLLTAANAAVVGADAERDDLTAAIRQIKHTDDVVKLAMNVGWSVRYLRRIEAELRERLTAGEVAQVDGVFAASGADEPRQLRAISGGLS